MEDDTSTKTDSPEPRKELVSVAVQFLQSPRIVKSPQEIKVAFLKKKGLTDAEIELAVQDVKKLTSVPRLESPVHSLDVGSPRTVWGFLHNAANTLAIFSVLGYVTYVLYKRYGEPFFFGKKKDGRSLETRLVELECLIHGSLTEIKENMSKIKDELEKAKGRNDSVLRQDLEDLKVEVKSLKNLFLHRKEFASTILSSSGQKVSIPEWQKLSDKECESPSPPATTSHDKDPEDSESSERGTNNGGSDSSLEVIK